MSVTTPDAMGDSLEGLERPVVLALIDPIRYQDAVLELLRFFTARAPRGVYVSLNKPFSILTKSFEKAGISTTSLFFVDGITNVPSVQEEKDHACLGSGVDLSNLCIGISKAINGISGEKYLVLDSLSTLLIYNDLTIATVDLNQQEFDEEMVGNMMDKL